MLGYLLWQDAISAIFSYMRLRERSQCVTLSLETVAGLHTQCDHALK